MRGALHVDDPTGERWSIALDLLRTGDGMVTLGDRILLYKDAAGPRATGRLVIEVVASRSRGSLTLRQAETDVAEALALLQRIDDDLGQLECEGIERVYVEDLDTSRVNLGGIADDGSIDWSPDREPRT